MTEYELGQHLNQIVMDLESKFRDIHFRFSGSQTHEGATLTVYVSESEKYEAVKSYAREIEGKGGVRLRPTDPIMKVSIDVVNRKLPDAKPVELTTREAKLRFKADVLAREALIKKTVMAKD